MFMDNTLIDVFQKKVIAQYYFYSNFIDPLRIL